MTATRSRPGWPSCRWPWFTVAGCSSGGASLRAIHRRQRGRALRGSVRRRLAGGGPKDYKDLTVGFIQTGSEGGWRAANTASFKDEATKLGLTLKFYDAQNKMENQLTAFRNFIADDEVDVIILAALEAAGWDDVLKEAKDKGKTVVLEDRRIDAPEDLYATYIGSDFTLEGRKAADEMCMLLEGSAKKNVVELVGNVGSSAAIDRGKGFREKMGDCGITITESQTGDWDSTKGKAVTEAFLKKSKDIQGVFAQNDEMGLGAIQALKEAGLKPADGRQDHHRRRHQGRLRGDDRRQDQHRRRVQPAARPAGLRGGPQGGQRRDPAQVGPVDRERLLPGERGARSCRRARTEARPPHSDVGASSWGRPPRRSLDDHPGRRPT